MYILVFGLTTFGTFDCFNVVGIIRIYSAESRFTHDSKHLTRPALGRFLVIGPRQCVRISPAQRDT